MRFLTLILASLPLFAYAEVEIDEEFSSSWACATAQREVISNHWRRYRALRQCKRLVEDDGVPRRVIRPDVIVTRVGEPPPEDPPHEDPPPDDEHPPEDPHEDPPHDPPDDEHPDGHCFDGCEAYIDGSGSTHCPTRLPDSCWQGTYSEDPQPDSHGWWHYHLLTGPPEDDPPHDDPPPDDEHPDDPPDDPPPPPSDPSAYRGIPDPSGVLGYDPWGSYQVDSILTGNRGDAHLSGVGSASDPYVIDISGATFRSFDVTGSYVIVQGGTVNAPSRSGPFIDMGHGKCTRCTVRNVHLSGPKTNQSHSAAVDMGSRNVWIGGSVHGFGDNRQNAPEQDFHGMKVFGPDVWILDAEIYDVSGDSVQVGDANGQATRVYIGGGHFHHNRENAVDIKDSRDVVVSGVRMNTFRPTSSSPGEAVIIHDDAFDAKILDSAITDSSMGIVSSGARGHLIEGNDITALSIGIQLRNTSNITVRDNSISAPSCVQRQSGVSGTVQSGCN